MSIFASKVSALRPAQLLIFLLLFVLALDSKEMAVTLPVIILTYEFLKAPRWADWKAFLRWSWRDATPSLIAGAVTAIYLYGKLYGTGSLTRLDPYRPRYSWHQFVEANAKFLGELFFATNAITPKTFWILWVAVFIYAVFRRDRTVRLMAVWVVIVPLPIAFLLPIRGGGCLYLLLFGWAMIFAKVSCDLIALISRTFMFPGQRVAVDRKTEAMSETHDGGATRDAATLGILRAMAGKTPGWTVRIVLVSVLAVSFALFTDWENRRLRTAPNLLGVGEKVSHVIAAFDSLNLRPAPHSTVLLKPDEQLFQNKWHPLFIASLVWNDHSLQIWIDKLSKITPEQLAKIDYIISLSEFRADIVRSPGIRDSAVNRLLSLEVIDHRVQKGTRRIWNNAVAVYLMSDRFWQWIARRWWFFVCGALLTVLVLIHITSLRHKGLTTDEPGPLPVRRSCVAWHPTANRRHRQ